MKKARAATDEVLAYFDSFPTGKTRAKGAKIHVEFPRKGPLDKKTPLARVEAWAAHCGLKATAVGGTEGTPEEYLFEKKTP